MLLWLLKMAVLVYVGFGVVLYLAQRQMLYLPTPAHDTDAIDSEWLDTGGARIKLWVLRPGSDRALIYFGGNGEDTFYSAQSFAEQLPDTTVYLVNYRGYGGSSGRPHESGLFADGLAVFDAVGQRHSQVAMAGRSLGSGIAVYVAAHRPVSRLVLITPHDSVVRLAKRLYPIYPVEWLLKDRYESVRYAPDVSSPALVITAEYDNLVPAVHSRRLVAALKPELVTQVVIPNSGHNDLSLNRQYMTAIRDHLVDTVGTRLE